MFCEEGYARRMACYARSLTKGPETVNLYGLSRNCGEAEYRAGSFVPSLSRKLDGFRYECEKPRRGFFGHFLKPSCGAARGESVEQCPPLNCHVPEAIGCGQAGRRTKNSGKDSS